MKLRFPSGRQMWIGRRPNGGLALQQGTSRVLLAPDELLIVLAAITELTTPTNESDSP
ncbi:MAG: hypothetical protein QOE04_4803 [Mycobacterium sp.]|jgi:hypothetical protein|nr:hypothetical protein [Mycobacterium sp.]